MVKVKTFTSQLKIFHTVQELAKLDHEVNEFLAAEGGKRRLIGVSDAVTNGGNGQSIGIIRTIAYED